MEKIFRNIKLAIEESIERGKSVLLLGPRQVGKTTLINTISTDWAISLARPSTRQQYEREIESFSQETEALAEKLSKKPLIFIDEVQKIPELLDAVQDLIDRKIAQFILTGSSARKLKTQKHLNLLPGRIVYLNMDPLAIDELPKTSLNIDDLLAYGSLPAIITDKNNSAREQDLESYVMTYLEEEVRQEALVRKLGDFAKFLQLAASESGQLSNFNNISKDIGVAQTTIASYYQILEDCLIVERIEPFLKTTSARKRLVKSCKYLFFDLGVKRIAAREGTQPSNTVHGKLFEQFVGLELLRLARSNTKRVTLNFWRDLEGREVDWVLSHKGKIFPIEVKWTEKPNIKDTRHLKTFLDDYKIQHGYIVCRCNKARKLDDRISAIPWKDIPKILD